MNLRKKCKKIIKNHSCTEILRAMYFITNQAFETHLMCSTPMHTIVLNYFNEWKLGRDFNFNEHDLPDYSDLIQFVKKFEDHVTILIMDRDEETIFEADCSDHDREDHQKQIKESQDFFESKIFKDIELFEKKELNLDFYKDVLVPDYKLYLSVYEFAKTVNDSKMYEKNYILYQLKYFIGSIKNCHAFAGISDSMVNHFFDTLYMMRYTR